MTWLFILLGVIGFLLLVFFITLIFLHHFTFYTPVKGQNDIYALTPETTKLGIDKQIFKMINDLTEKKYTDAYITSYDKLKLHARIYENPKSNKVAIMCHGYRGTAIRDFSGGALDLINQGLNVILIDERGHGFSKGHNITFGNREKYDVLSWYQYAQNRFGKNKEYILVGISMGAATILFAASLIKEPIKLICDCPYTSEKEILCESIKNMKLSPRFFYPILNLSSILFSHSSMNKDNAFISVKGCPHKILIIHGDNDTMVPHKFSLKLAETYPNIIHYELFPHAEHGLSYIVDVNRYKKIVTDFINQ